LSFDFDFCKLFDFDLSQLNITEYVDVGNNSSQPAGYFHDRGPTPLRYAVWLRSLSAR